MLIKIMLGITAAAVLTASVMGWLWHREGKLTAAAEAAVSAAVDANASLAKTVREMTAEQKARDELLAENRRQVHEISELLADQQAQLRDAIRGDECASVAAPDDVIGLFRDQGGDEDGASPSVPASKPKSANPGA